MTRKLCDVAMDCIVEAYDDGNRTGIWKFAIYEGDDEIVSLTVSWVVVHPMILRILKSR